MIALLLTLLLVATANAAGDPARGAEVFRQNCSDCHSREPGETRTGPTLFSVVGRPAGSIVEYPYSVAMRHSGLVWTPDHLMLYLRAPRKYLPGVKMSFPGLRDKKDREDVVAFLGTLHTAPRAGGNGAAPQSSKSAAIRGSQ